MNPQFVNVTYPAALLDGRRRYQPIHELAVKVNGSDCDGESVGLRGIASHGQHIELTRQRVDFRRSTTISSARHDLFKRMLAFAADVVEHFENFVPNTDGERRLIESLPTGSLPYQIEMCLNDDTIE